MSIQDKIQIVLNASKNIKEAIISKGVTPSGGINTYAEAINNIEMPPAQPLEILPSTSTQEIIATGDIIGYNPITIHAVDSSIDSDIKPENIKYGVNILGVEGSLVKPSGSIAVNTNGTYEISNYKDADVNISSGIKSKYGCPITTLLGNLDDNGSLILSESSLVNLNFNGVKDLADNALFYKFINKPISSVSFPSLTTISGSESMGSCFFGNENLTSIDFPSLTTISGDDCMSEAFYKCTSLTSIDFPSLTTISGDMCMDSCFSSCTNLTSISFPSLTTISDDGRCMYWTFYKCTSLPSVSFPSLTTIIGGGMYYTFYNCTSLTSASFPSLTTISGDESMYHTFYKCTSLTSVSFPSLTSISDYNGMGGAFSGCTSLTSIDFPSLTTINGYNGMYWTFEDCASLTSASFPSLTTISGSETMDYAFYGCTSLTSIDFPSLTTISSNKSMCRAFYNCTSLTSVSFPSLTSSSFGRFYTNQFNSMLSGVTGCTVHFPSNLESVIGSWSDVTSGFGGTNTTVLFDLEATE